MKRSEQQCINCRFSQAIQDEAKREAPYWAQPHLQMECRRRAPHAYGRELDEYMGPPALALWPIVKAGAWCGEHKPREPENHQ